MIKCHLGISSNIYSAYKPLTCKTMHGHVEIFPKYIAVDRDTEFCFLLIQDTKLFSR